TGSERAVDKATDVPTHRGNPPKLVTAGCYPSVEAKTGFILTQVIPVEANLYCGYSFCTELFRPQNAFRMITDEYVRAVTTTRDEVAGYRGESHVPAVAAHGRNEGVAI